MAKMDYEEMLVEARHATLRERCTQFYQSQGRNAMLRQGSSVEDLIAFVVAETGRAADKSLDPTLPLCLYFGTKEDREEFVALVREAKPGMMMKQLP